MASKARLPTMVVCPRSGGPMALVCDGAPTFQRLMSPELSPVASIRASGLKATELAGALRNSVRLSFGRCRSEMSQTSTRLSLPALAITCPPGLNATWLTTVLCPVSGAPSSAGWAGSETFHSSSRELRAVPGAVPPPTASVAPSGLKATEESPCPWTDSTVLSRRGCLGSATLHSCTVPVWLKPAWAKALRASTRLSGLNFRLSTAPLEAGTGADSATGCLASETSRTRMLPSAPPRASRAPWELYATDPACPSAASGDVSGAGRSGSEVSQSCSVPAAVAS